MPRAHSKPASPARVPTGSIAVIGMGNWGSSLTHALAESKLALREVVVRKKPQRGSGLPLKSWTEAALDAELLWICTPDGAIASVCAEILRKRPALAGQIVLHSSGALPASLLRPAEAAGAKIASVHPVMSFPNRTQVSLAGLMYGVETGDAGAARRIRSVLRALGGKAFAIAPGSKSQYHAAGTLASPLLVSALVAATKTAGLAGLTAREASKMVGVLAQATLRNVLARGPASSFSGPFARGDAGTIRLHLRALEEHPVLAQVYRALAENAVCELPVRARKALEAELSPKRNSRRD
jgi:predicted short-subunit dehydrogenase-like oxidoreductase (DUF2520 family)